jgi:hypothetical protein
VRTFLLGTFFCQEPFFIRNFFSSGTFIIQEPFFHRSFILPGMPFIQEPFSGNLSVSGAFFTGTLFAGTFRWELFGRNVLAGTFRDPAFSMVACIWYDMIWFIHFSAVSIYIHALREICFLAMVCYELSLFSNCHIKGLELNQECQDCVSGEVTCKQYQCNVRGICLVRFLPPRPFLPN